MSEPEFPETLWGDIVDAAGRGAEAVVQLVMQLADEEQRLAAFKLAATGLALRDWPGKSLDVAVAVADAAIAEGVRQSEAATDAELRAARLDWANQQSYNLSANLCDCWPGEAADRTRAQFERGLRAAEQCLEWRRQAGKGAGPFSMAHWAEGYHALALGDHDRALTAFRESLQYAQEAATEAGLSAELDDQATFAVALAHGYLGLARAAAGDAAGRSQLQAAFAVFERQVAAKGDKADDAEFGIDQLELAAARRGLDLEAGG